MTRRPARTRAYLILLLLASLLPACATFRPESGGYDTGHTEEGYASWYGPGFHGKHAANGELYDQEAFTAAHRTMPFGTLVEVTRRDTGERVVVRVTDRGPFVRGRILDLSRGAARQLGAIGPGVVPVTLRVVATPVEAARAAGTAYTIQLGSFESMANAEALKARLEPHIPGLRLLPADAAGGVRLVTRRYDDYRHAKKVAGRIRRNLTPGAFVVVENLP
ncbi:MAG: septal ring lytic transglycosylase RlpA family protein [Nitrospirae bacterium]|nr:septal ring lytic transglycosylase RlpA family protein [Nitrospirota bacterium]